MSEVADNDDSDYDSLAHAKLPVEEIPHKNIYREDIGIYI